MALYIDTANLEEIRSFLSFHGMGGVTTNPSILAAAGARAEERLKNIAELLSEKHLLFAQTREMPAEGIASEGERLHSIFPGGVVIKLPFCEESLKAVPLLKQRNIRTCPTAIFNASQAYLAGAAGADWVAVYVNRITKLGGDGIEVVRTIAGIFEAAGMSTRVLAASVKTLEQVEALLEINDRVDVTIGYSLFQAMLVHPATEKALRQFALDAAKVF